MNVASNLTMQTDLDAALVSRPRALKSKRHGNIIEQTKRGYKSCLLLIFHGHFDLVITSCSDVFFRKQFPENMSPCLPTPGLLLAGRHLLDIEYPSKIKKLGYKTMKVYWVEQNSEVDGGNDSRNLQCPWDSIPIGTADLDKFLSHKAAILDS